MRYLALLKYFWYFLMHCVACSVFLSKRAHFEQGFSLDRGGLCVVVGKLQENPQNTSEHEAY